MRKEKRKEPTWKEKLWSQYEELVKSASSKEEKKELLKSYRKIKSDYSTINEKIKKAPPRERRTTYKTDTNYSSVLKRFVKENKEKATDAEKVFYDMLKDMRIHFEYQKPYKFTNQTWRYILDFYIPSHKLIIEIDGGYHNTKEQIEKDKLRDKRFLKIGLKTIRLTNDDVLNKSNRLIFLLKKISK